MREKDTETDRQTDR